LKRSGEFKEIPVKELTCFGSVHDLLSSILAREIP
jgi:hypothetical protein